jgi:ABC-type transport system involved in Fe-S cluster assembly fused permease/ATPase subunit
MLNIEGVQLYCAEDFERRRILDAVRRQQELQVKLDTSMAVLNFGQQLAFIVAAGLNLHFASAGILAGTMTVGDLVLVDSLFVMLYTPLSMLGIWFREFSSAVVNTKNAVSMLDSVPAIRDAQDAVPMIVPASSSSSPRVGTIEFRNVSFGFREGKRVLNDVSLTIPGGAFVGFVGPSGSGKSTILRLVFRFFDADSGQVLVDGQDVRGVTLDSLRRRFAVIPQDAVLFNESVRYNIAYGRAGRAEAAPAAAPTAAESSANADGNTTTAATTNATTAASVAGSTTGLPATDAEVEAAARQAHIHDAVARMPLGYETVVGERGLKLSGGERQRVAIARALLKDADIVLADEATSALDSVTEAKVVRELRGAAGGRRRTLVCVAHRLSTVKDCDIIFVLNAEGRLQERGTHAELLALPHGLYAMLWHKQQKKLRAGGSSGSGSGAGGDDDDADDEDEDDDEVASAAAKSTLTQPPQQQPQQQPQPQPQQQQHGTTKPAA